MKPSPTVIGLLSSVVLATAAPSLATPFQNEHAPSHLAQVQPDRHEEQRGERPARHHAGTPDRDRGDRRDDRRGERHGPNRHVLDLAGKLAAAETYVGITGEQEEAWRGYTTALIDFLDRSAPVRGERGPDQRRAEGARPEGPRPARLFAEGLADRAIAQGEKAQTLREAVEALRSALSDEQLGRLADAEQAFAPGPHGPDGGTGGRRGPHHDRGEQRPVPSAPQPPAED